MPTQSSNPRTGISFGAAVADTSPAELDSIVSAAVMAAPKWAAVAPRERANVLQAVAEALDAAAAELIPLADAETGLGLPRLTGELARTTFQLRMFAAAVAARDFAGIRIDPAVPGPPPAGRPELARMLVPLGPVAVYGASNFPFAFSVPGGDTASALAAGCPVVVKAHPAHPQTCELAAAVMARTLSSAGAPDGTFALVRGFEAGTSLVTHRGITAAAFTGSYGGGRALFDLAVGRPDPIPFYGELGSVNPVVVTPGAAERGDVLAVEYVDSLTLGTGQFCTNPGLLLVPAGSGLVELIAASAATRRVGVMLHAGVKSLFADNIAQLSALPGVRVLLDNSDALGVHSGPVILAVNGVTALASPQLLHTECFGPGAVLVEYSCAAELLTLLNELEGCLVATVHGLETEPLAATLVSRLASIAGRVVWNGWPTGVAVTAAQHHGGPHPATTSSLHTSVGTAAAERFLRPVVFQSVPQAFLPIALRG